MSKESPALPSDTKSELIGKLDDVERLFLWSTWRRHWKALILLALLALPPYWLVSLRASFWHFYNFPSSASFEVCLPNDLLTDSRTVLQRQQDIYRAWVRKTHPSGQLVLAVWEPSGDAAACRLRIVLPTGFALLNFPEAMHFRSGHWARIPAAQNEDSTEIVLDAPALTKGEGVALLLVATKPEGKEPLGRRPNLNATVSGDRLKWFW